MEIDDIKLKDVYSRTQLTTKKSYMTAAKKSLSVDANRAPTAYGKFQGVKITNKRIGVLDRPIKSETPSETDEEDWIKANIIKVEPQPKIARQTKIKTIYPQHQGNLIVNRKRPSVENTQVRAGGKKIIIDAGSVMKSSFVNKTSAKRIVISSRPTIVMDPNDLIDEDGADDIDNSPESRHEVQACFLSLIRDIFCSTRDHRMKLEELRNRINVWLSNPIASANDWFMQASDWGSLLISSVHFLSGEFQDQPEDFVPYLEFKSQLNIYQWIGAGRDSDARMTTLCQYWLSRRNEMGVKLKYKTLAKTSISPEKNEENHLQQAVSPPNARCRTDWKVQSANDDDVQEFRVQERQRYENPHLPFTYRQHGYESVVGPLRGIYSQSPVASKARDHNTLIADRPNFVTILALVRDAAARLPNGEGTRYDICELLKSSQYIIPGTTDSVIQSIVSGALDRMHTEPDPCIKYDTKRKLWIYVHRNRSEGDFERLHQQQGVNRQKKPVFRKTKLLDAQQLITISSPMRVVSSPNTSVRTYQTKIVATTSKPVPSLTTFEHKQKIPNQPSSQLLKISPKRYVKTMGNEKSMEPIDVEASLDAQTIVKSADPKQRITLKNIQQMSPIRIVTSSPNYAQTSQSVIINRSQSPKVMSAKKVVGKPMIISQSQAPPLVSQSSPNTGYLVPMMKQGSEPPALSVPKTTMLQHKNVIKLSPSAGKNLASPQQKIILTSASAKGGKILTIPKSQSPVTMLSQQKQILTNVIVQQQKAKGQNQIIMNTQQKMPGLTISSPGSNPSSPQVIQIQQTSADGKITLSPANLTPQQRQSIFQSLKQFKQGGNQQTMIVKQQVVKSIGNEVPAPPLVSVSGNVGKIMKTGATTMAQQPQVIVSMAQKNDTGSPVVARVVSAAGRQLIDGILPKAGTTFKIAGGQNATVPSNLIQISQGSQVAQYTVVSKGKNIISVSNQGKLITTQANTQSHGIITSTGNVMNQAQQNVPNPQPIKIVQGGSITAQQLMGAKLINVQALANKGIKTAGGIK